MKARFRELKIGILLRADMEQLIAELERAGVEVAYSYKKNGLLSTTYYNLTFEGREYPVQYALRCIRMWNED